MYFAQLNSDNKVLKVIALSDEFKMYNVNDQMTEEQLAIAYLQTIYGENVVFVETKEGIREREAVIGGSYDFENDCFISASPFASWVYDYSTHEWKSPVEHPNFAAANASGLTVEELELQNEDLDRYWWNEDQLNWEKFQGVVAEPA